MRQLVVRAGAMGDVLDTTPIIARLKREDPGGEIDIETQHPYVFWGNPNVFNLKRRGELAYDRIINLDMAYENQLRQVCGIDCYSQIAFGDEKTSRELSIYFGRPVQSTFDYKHAIVVHPARSWPSRTLPRDLWQEIIDKLAGRGWVVIVIGTRQDWGGPWGHRICDTGGKLTLAEQAAVINASAAFLCSDNGMMIVAQATRAPVVALLTISLPFLSERERRGKMGWGFYPITSSARCIGCGHRQADPTKHFDCEWAVTRPFDENKCVTMFNPIDIVEKVTWAAKHHVAMNGNWHPPSSSRPAV